MNSMRAQVTLQQIAEEGGVSRATVSLALRSHPSIPLQTRERIQALAEKLDYRPNPLVSTLMSYKRRSKGGLERGLSLGLILEFARGDAWQSYLSPNLIAGAKSRAERQGFNLEEFWMGDEGLTPERLGQILYHRNLTGVIVAPFSTPGRSLNLSWQSLSAVGIGYSLGEPNLHRITTDRYQAMVNAIEQLSRRGYRRIGLALHLNEDLRVHHRWTGAFLWHQQQLDSPEQIPPFIVSRPDWTEEQFLAWFAKHRPEAVLCTTSEPYEWLRKAGHQIPEEVGFVHLWKPEAGDSYTGVFHNDFAIGEAAVDFLVAMIHRNERGLPAVRQTLVLSTSWIDGKTTENPRLNRAKAAGCQAAPALLRSRARAKSVPATLVPPGSRHRARKHAGSELLGHSS